MTAVLTTTEHGVCATLYDAVLACRAGRDAAGFGARTFTTSVNASSTSYVDIYKFTEGVGTYQDTYVKFYNNTSQTIYQQGQSVVLDGNNFPTNTLADAGIASQASVGTGVIGSTTLIGSYGTGIAYRSLSFKPQTGSQYGVHIYQRYDSSGGEWQTVLGEVYVKFQNKPAAVTADTVALTQFMFFDNLITRYHNYYDGPRWVYTDSPYTAWSGRNPLESYDRTAIYTRLGHGTTGYIINSGTNYNGVQAVGGAYTTHGTDYFMRACDPMVYDVFDISSDGITYKLAKPLVLRHRSRPIGVTPSDFSIGPALKAGTELTVSASEIYTAIGGSLYLRTT